MRLLDRYLLRELLVPFAYCLAGFLIFFIAFDVLDELANFQKFRLRAGDVLAFYMVKIPEFIVTVAPVAFLLALLYTLTNLGRHHEITAIRAAGISLLRMSLPYLMVGVALSLGVFAINELWAPQSVERAEEIMNRRRPGAAAAAKVWEQKVAFNSGLNAQRWFISAFHLETFDLIGVNVLIAPSDQPGMTFSASRGWRETNTWVFTNVTLNYDAAGAEFGAKLHYDTRAMPEFTETPEQILSEIKIGRLNSARRIQRAQFSVREILNYRRLHPDGTVNDGVLNTKLHGRLATPWTCLVVVVIALPFGAASGRRNVFAGVASSIVICFVYFILGQTALTLGSGGHLPGWVAAWAPNLLFGLAGIVMTLRVR